MALERAFDDSRFTAGVGEALETLHQQGKTSLKRLPEALDFVAAFFQRATPGDLKLHDESTWAAVIADLLAFVAQRSTGTANVRVFNPDEATHGWTAKGTVLQVVTDDSPFLVDSVGMAVNARKLDTHAVIHPVVHVQRDGEGRVSGLAGESGGLESVMHFEIDRISDAPAREALESYVRHMLGDVRVAVRDWKAMRDQALAIAEELPTRHLSRETADVAEAQELLRWIADDHFTFLGYREYEVTQDGGEDVLRAIEDSGLGILHRSERSVAPRSLRTLAAAQLHRADAADAIILTKTNARSDIHRPGHMDYIGVLKFDKSGKPVYEQRFLGLFTSSAYMRRPQDVPVLRRKCARVMERSGLRADSYSGKTLRHILESLPRDELFQSSEDELFDIATGIIDLKERPRARLFVRRDRYERFFSCLAFVPRDRFNTTVRKRIESMLYEAFHGVHLDSSLLMAESALTRLHITVRPKPGDHPQYDLDELETRLVHAVRDWRDDLRTRLVDELGEVEGSMLAHRFADVLPAGYIEQVTPEIAARDVQVLNGLDEDSGARMSLYRSGKQLRFKVYRMGGDIALSDVLPQLENLGMRVHTERVYQMELDGRQLSIQDLEVEPVLDLAFDVEAVGNHFERAFENVWLGRAESDDFNRLVLGAFLDWRQVAMLRGYCKYLQQVGIAFSQSYMEETLNRYPAIANLLVELFNAKFDPARETRDDAQRQEAGEQLRRELEVLVPAGTVDKHPTFIDDTVAALTKPRDEQVHVYWEAIKALLDGVASLDDERIIKSYMDIIRATTRTSFFQRFDGRPRHYISFKFDSALVPDAPKPVPFREIWVYGPRVEGVHLRFGMVARGGLRWSDRREDFRTEVLGLVKAQMVKNTVIVPVGSKGGFFPKQLPNPAEDRDAWLEEGKACYRMFIAGMLDITDNLIDDKVVPPADVVRHDGDDSYLVVAADKGTAKFSDIANGISGDHGYWLDDAFASGGSHGYDHKGMGITAKGAWESVKRHFRALGHDSQAEDFTCVGIGDMSGDVFGNGMLLSEHIRLVAAFDHRDIFVDPKPDSAVGFRERKRLFDLPRSSWQDYDTSLISEGGGVFSRSAKSIPVSAQMREALGLAGGVEQLTPNELMSAVLRAPVDLLWNGGIGTYVKASTETHGDVGDRSNNALRVDGSELRCRVIGEGGNLGFTQKGRIEAALKGIVNNTDFIDNSAGVDTSDHEVNIKILLGDAVQRGELDFDARNKQLAAMTDEVEKLVLWDNYRQNQAITLMEHMAVKRLGTMGHFIRTLEEEGRLDRQVESLPSDAEIAERKQRGQGLTRPELAILLSYDKIKLFEQLLDSDVPEDPYLSHELQRYFPEPLRSVYAEHMQRHRLKREIIASAVTNSTVNRMGATFMLRMQEDTGQGPAAIAKAFTAAREILDARELWAAIEALDGKVAEATQMDAILHIWTLLRHMTRWLLNRPGGTLDIAANVERYRPAVTALRQALPDTLTPTGQADYALSVEKWQGLDFTPELAERLARAPVLRSALDMAEVAHYSGQPIEHVASVFFNLAETLDLDWLRSEIEALPVEGRWHAQARGSLLDELNHQHRELAVKVLAWAADRDESKPVAAWLDRDDPTLRYTRSVLAEIMSQTADYPIASVALRRLAQLAQTA